MTVLEDLLEELTREVSTLPDRYIRKLLAQYSVELPKKCPDGHEITHVKGVHREERTTVRTQRGWNEEPEMKFNVREVTSRKISTTVTYVCALGDLHKFEIETEEQK